jgi:UDP-glucose 6-dehydrogenase
MMNKINIGIIGCGFVGGALKKWLEEHNSDNVNLLISDPPKGFTDDMETTDIIFISIHLPTEDDGYQDLTLLKQIISKLPDKPIFIRTTILPGTADKLSCEFKKQVYFMPEFLTERTAYQDFCSQKMIFTGEVELLKKIFPKKNFIEMSSIEAEMAKYVHNVFGALKVTYFNGIFDICDKIDIKYQKVLEGVLASEYINPMHTKVPGPDGKFGFGGKCFPKDVNAFVKQFKDYPIYDLLKVLNPLNQGFRKDDR